MSYKIAQEKLTKLIQETEKEKKLHMNTVKMNGIDGWPTHASENNTVYVGYTCTATPDSNNTK
jgi:hypothetical protein